MSTKFLRASPNDCLITEGIFLFSYRFLIFGVSSFPQFHPVHCLFGHPRFCQIIAYLLIHILDNSRPEMLCAYYTGGPGFETVTGKT